MVVLLTSAKQFDTLLQTTRNRSRVHAGGDIVPMNAFDLTIIHFLNAFVHRSTAMDTIVVFVMNDFLLRGGFVMALFWSAWAPQNDAHAENREVLAFGLVLSICSVLTARILAFALPFRLRPMHNPMLFFKLPYTMDPSTLNGWSSFPSDTATLFFCLAAVLWMTSRRLGILAMCHAVLFVSLPRIYVGIHYPSDILAGALLGCSFASLATFTSIRKSVTAPILRMLTGYPTLFYACLFLVTFEFAIVFDTEFALVRTVRLAQVILQSAR
jgi:undecaprenyl-diphosphatase